MNSYNISSHLAVLPRSDVDTDQIIAKQFLARVSRTGYGPFLFYDWRYADDTICEISDEEGDFVFENKVLNPDFELNNDHFHDAEILLAGNNFGCGSSREHAVWAIMQDGYRVVIAPRVGDTPAFADIFRGNSLKNGLLVIELSEDEVIEIMKNADKNSSAQMDISLENQTVTFDGKVYHFEFESGIKRKLLSGEDDISVTLLDQKSIEKFEESSKY